MDWLFRAACGDKPSEWFFPSPSAGGRGGASVAYEKARKVCDGCPVRTECLADALNRESGYSQQGHGRGPYRYGMWGGLTPDERSELMRLKAFRRQVA